LVLADTHASSSTLTWIKPMDAGQRFRQHLDRHRAMLSTLLIQVMPRLL